jgi:ATP-dependent DNA helicase RecG
MPNNEAKNRKRPVRSDSQRLDSDTEIREFKIISGRANRLLHREEDFDVDFKRSISGLESDDLVSFANSRRGGAILIGVDESKDGNGRQTAVVVGCPIGDGEKLKILSKSNQCSPPVRLSVFVENSDEKPFYRIEIPSGPHKPYCTSGGTYKTRGDGRKETLHPPQLLSLFLETEGGEFLRRFQEATANLEVAVRETKERISTELTELNESVRYTESNILESLQGIDATASAAQDNADEAKAYSEDAMHIIDAVHSMVEDLGSGDPELGAVSQKLDALLERFEIEDPAITNYRRYVKALTLALTERNTRNGKPDDRKWIINTVAKHMAKGVNRRIVTRWVNEAIDDPRAAKDDAARLSASDASFVPMIAESTLRTRATANGPKRSPIHRQKTRGVSKPVKKLKGSPRAVKSNSGANVPF